jgi:predicted nucleotidyltransferase component of viral defense system
MGRAQFEQSKIAPKLRFRLPAEDQASTAPIRIKLEIHTRERIAYDPPSFVPFEVTNPWFTGSAEVTTFSKEEILATKLRALLQRDKGRDLLDLAHAKACSTILRSRAWLLVSTNISARRVISSRARRPKNACSAN